MPISKNRISSPLEAGASLLGAKQLPAQLTSALDYISDRLARKRLHLTLIAVCKDVNINPGLSPSSPNRTPSPAQSVFGSDLSKHASQSSVSDCMSTISSSSASSKSSLSRTRWPSLPSSPKDASAAPLSPSSSSTFSSPATPISPNSNPWGISLMHACTLTSKAEKVLRSTISKAEKKFEIGSGWLSAQSLTKTISCPATNDLIRRSIVQNEIIFSSEGLTLLSLDHVYTFKCQLHTYSRTLSPVDFSLAVDELRRLILAQYGRSINKGYLMRTYDWLGISLAALVDVNEGYKTAYGGQARSGGIEVQALCTSSPPPLKTSFGTHEFRRVKLSLSTNFSASSASTMSSGDRSPSRSPHDRDDMPLIAVGESAKGREGRIDRIREDRGPHRRGPITPNGFEDITPVTKGEWCFLMVGDGWKGRTAAVETC